MDPYKTDKRPRMPRLLAEVLEEKKEDENEGLWKPLIKNDEELQRELKEKEKELQRELERSFGHKDRRLDRTLEDII